MGKANKWIGIALFGLAVVLMAIFPVLAWGVIGGISGGAQACATDNIPASSTTVKNPKGGTGAPAQFVPIYQAAAAKYKLGSQGPSILASIHGIESGFGENQGPSSAGAVGHMQFMPATWAAYGVDANGDGQKDPANAEDAIFAAARYLRASGAPKNWHDAIFAYNHAEWYVQDVFNDAKKYNIPATGNSTLDDGSADCDPAGSVGGVPGLPDISDIPIKPAGPDGYTELPPSKYYELVGGSHTGQENLVKLIAATSKAWKQQYPKDTVYVSDLNAPGHASHACGQDVDIWTTSAGNMNLSTYSRERSVEYGDLWFSTKQIVYIFFNDDPVRAEVNAYAKKNNDPGVMQFWPNHEDHFHVRVKDKAGKC